jgi:hypothetical protein
MAVALQQDNALHLPSYHATRKRCPPGEYEVAQVLRLSSSFAWRVGPAAR